MIDLAIWNQIQSCSEGLDGEFSAIACFCNKIFIHKARAEWEEKQAESNSQKKSLDLGPVASNRCMMFLLARL